jgi:hypothetical protein
MFHAEQSLGERMSPSPAPSVLDGQTSVRRQKKRETLVEYLFYPFNDKTEVATIDELARGISPGTPAVPIYSPAYGLIFCSNGTYPGGLGGVNDNDDVIVIGHAASGLKVLGSATKELIDQSEIVQRLAACGLPKTANCRIILYACESAAGGERALAKKVAQQLRNSGFNCCNRVWGFTHKVSMLTHFDQLAGRRSLCVEYGGTWQAYSLLEESRAFIRCEP